MSLMPIHGNVPYAWSSCIRLKKKSKGWIKFSEDSLQNRFFFLFKFFNFFQMVLHGLDKYPSYTELCWQSLKINFTFLFKNANIRVGSSQSFTTEKVLLLLILSLLWWESIKIHLEMSSQNTVWQFHWNFPFSLLLLHMYSLWNTTPKWKVRTMKKMQQ